MICAEYSLKGGNTKNPASLKWRNRIYMIACAVLEVLVYRGMCVNFRPFVLFEETF